MKKEQYYEDRTKWGVGEWQNEPDRISWIDEDTGYNCLMMRNGRGAWCGYVAIEKAHPLYKKHYDELNDMHVLVHGGLTYSEECDGDVEKGICHPTKDKDNAWWFGFDCSHAWDVSPAETRNRYFYGSLEPYYKSVSYVEREVQMLATQLKEAEEAIVT